MGEKLGKERLRILQGSNLERCSLADVGEILFKTNGDPELAMRLKSAYEGYFQAFAKPEKRNGEWICLNCGSQLTGILGSFVWGLAHGEGNCGSCGYLGRGAHYTKRILGDLFNSVKGMRDVRIDFILQYHPSLLSWRKKG